ncbi:MAG TPA: nucleoside deaminase [Bacteroidota bacterium]|nr:nucleoside deaminase [Bacteroidota bacterium]
MQEFMNEAIAEARSGLAEGGIPIGSVLVLRGTIIGRGHNRRVQEGNAMKHAEIDCLMNAGRLATYRDTVLYSTLMPCYLCAGAAVQFRIPKIVVGENSTFPGAEKFMKEHGLEVINLELPECREMMREFIRSHRALWNEDIGV